jgi:uncharacterized protein YcgI (DUF1989 family)
MARSSRFILPRAGTGRALEYTPKGVIVSPGARSLEAEPWESMNHALTSSTAQVPGRLLCRQRASYPARSTKALGMGDELQEPNDAAERRKQRPVVAYPAGSLPKADMARLDRARQHLTKLSEVIVPPRDARCFQVPAGHFFRIASIDGPQVGDLNLWNSADLSKRFFSGKTRALHATHVSMGDRLWSTLPYLRPMATITWDSLAWYGWDADGAGVHDVIGTRCDPYTNRLLSGQDYHHCCHSNLARALAAARAIPVWDAELLVHDVLNVFMCTGFTRDTHQYFMKASPVRPGDFIEFFAEIDLLGGLSACPGGDCSATHSSDAAACFPLKVEILQPAQDNLEGWQATRASAYPRSHGCVGP